MLEPDNFVFKSATISTILCSFVQKIEKHRSCCHISHDATRVSLQC